MNRKGHVMKKVRVLQVRNRLIIVDGSIPLRYLDLDTNICHVFDTIESVNYKNIYIDPLGRIRPRKNPTSGAYYFDGQFFFKLSLPLNREYL